MDIEGVIKID